MWDTMQIYISRASFHPPPHTLLYLFPFVHNPHIFTPNIVLFQFLPMSSMSKKIILVTESDNLFHERTQNTLPPKSPLAFAAGTKGWNSHISQTNSYYKRVVLFCGMCCKRCLLCRAERVSRLRGIPLSTCNQLSNWANELQEAEDP